MKKFTKLATIITLAIAATACTRIETGEVGLRVGMDKQVQSNELLPGSFNQTIIGDVLTFPVREVAVTLDNKQPMTADNSALSDFDVTVIYNINPSAVSDLWSKKSKAFHEYDEKSHDWILMHKFMETTVNNASYKVVRQYKALDVADKRKNIESELKHAVEDTLKDEKLDTAISLVGVQVRSIVPNAQIIESANAAIKAQNDLKTKSTEVEIAKKEAERIQALSTNKGAIDYMNAQAQMAIADGIKAGKVQTVVVPFDFRGIVNVK